METIIHLKNITKTYKNGDLIFNALKNINLKIETGKNVVIIGKSGSGKSTLLNMISGIDRPTSGIIEICGKDISSISEKELTKWRGEKNGIVFQFFQLLPTLSVIDNLILPMDFLKVIPKNQRKNRALELLKMTGIEKHAQKYPHELSGGEQQRVAIARSLANNPPIIIADEPTGNLDSVNAKIVKEIFKELNKQGKTIITVTHEQIDPTEYDVVIKISDGQIINQ